MEKGEFLRKLETELKISKNSEHTIKNYLRANSMLLEFAKKEPEQIVEQDIKEYMAENLTDSAASSIILFLSAVKYACSNILHKDPTTGIKRPKKEKKLPSVLSKEEVKKLINSLENKKSRLMVSLMYAAGMRISELINLKADNLDFNEKVGYIR